MGHLRFSMHQSVVILAMVCPFAFMGHGQKSAAQEPTVPASEVGSATGGDDVVLLWTTEGQIVIELLADEAPRHVERFKKLVQQGFYDGTRFHRCVPHFLIQGGDPYTREDERSRWGRGGSGQKLPAEFTERQHVRGSVGMARRADDPNSADSQFYICLDRAEHLDRQHTIFGRVISGMDVADAIAALPKDPESIEQSTPSKPAVLTKAQVLTRLEALRLAAGGLEP